MPDAPKKYKIQLGDAKPEEVDQKVIDHLEKYRLLDQYEVTELPTEPATKKPAELTKPAATTTN